MAETWPKSSEYFITTSGQAKSVIKRESSRNFKREKKTVVKVELHTQVISNFVKIVEVAAVVIYCINDLHIFTTKILNELSSTSTSTRISLFFPDKKNFTSSIKKRAAFSFGKRLKICNSIRCQKLFILGYNNYYFNPSWLSYFITFRY